MVNPLTLRTAKTGLALLEIFIKQKHFWEKLWRRNVNQTPSNNSSPNILWTFALIPNHFQKYESSRRSFPEELSVNWLCCLWLHSSFLYFQLRKVKEVEKKHRPLQDKNKKFLEKNMELTATNRSLEEKLKQHTEDNNKLVSLDN